MATSSLSKMTVPLASDQSSPVQGLLMPKLKYRFRVIFENFGVSFPRTELSKQVQKCDRPKLDFEDIDLHIYNSTVKLAGKYQWGEITVELRDDASGMVSRLVGEQLQKQLDFMEQSSAAAGIDYKFLMRMELLDGGNGAHPSGVLETWELYGAYIKSVEYGDMDYSASEPVLINLTLRFDNALQGPGQGVGAVVGRTVGDVATGVGQSGGNQIP